jgi:5-methylthioadenosine/S-adenosylhomocysteine deaminase
MPDATPEPTIIIENGVVLAAPGHDDPIAHGAVIVRGNKIAWVGRLEDCPREYIRPGRGTVTRIEAAGCAVMPGLVDAHAHFRGFRALGDGLGFMEWHDRYVHRFAERMSPQDAYYGAANTFLEMLRNGITTVLGMSSITVVEDSEIQAALDTGIRARMVPHIHEKGEVEQTIARIESESAGAADRVRTWLGMEVPQLVDAETMRLIGDAACRLGVGVHTHFSEVSRDSAERLARAGLLRRGLSLAHCVHLNEEDIGQFAAAGVSIAHNPRSNARYGNGIAPLRQFLDAGIVVGLGTDAPDSTFSCDLLAETQAATLFARASRRDPRALSCAEALRLATSGGAEAMGLDGEVGRLRPGAKADVIVIDLSGPSTAPVLVGGPHENILPLLVFGAVGRDVREVIVDGRILLRGGEFLHMDSTAVVAECQARAERILNQLTNLSGADRRLLEAVSVTGPLTAATVARRPRRDRAPGDDAAAHAGAGAASGRGRPAPLTAARRPSAGTASAHAAVSSAATVSAAMSRSTYGSDARMPLAMGWYRGSPASGFSQMTW